MIKKVFLATPITPLLDKNNMMALDAKKSIQAILKDFRSEICEDVFCAIEREKWGEELMNGIECTSLDMIGVKESDLMVAFVDQSYGVHLELGWASALEKPIVIMINENVGVKTPLVDGLSTITNAKIIYYQSDKALPSLAEWNSFLKNKTISAVNELIQKSYYNELTSYLEKNQFKFLANTTLERGSFVKAN